jgi:ATP-dependent Lhr-like helicase
LPADQRAARWAGLLLDRWGIVSRDVVKLEVAAPPWRDVRRALARLELLGNVRRGFMVEDLAGEQYARPEAVESLHAAKRRCAEGAADSADEPMVLLNACDPANPYGSLMQVTDAVGDEVRFPRNPTNYIVLRAGRPLMILHNGIHVLVDLTAGEAERAIRLFLGKGPCNVNAWNGHPIDVSPARHLLTTLGFVQGSTRWKGYVYDGVHEPSAEDRAEAEGQLPRDFERAGKEKAPVTYDAEWIIGRADPQIRPKLRELIDYLTGALPDECDIVYQPRGLIVRYRGVRCIAPHVQRRKINLHITHSGWVPPVAIAPDTELGPEGAGPTIMAKFEQTRKAVDEKLEERLRRMAGQE